MEKQKILFTPEFFNIKAFLIFSSVAISVLKKLSVRLFLSEGGRTVSTVVAKVISFA